MIYVLIWFVISSSGVATNKQEFMGEKACLTAKQEIESMSSFGVAVKAKCVLRNMY